MRSRRSIEAEESSGKCKGWGGNETLKKCGTAGEASGIFETQFRKTNSFNTAARSRHRQGN